MLTGRSGKSSTVRQEKRFPVDTAGLDVGVDGEAFTEVRTGCQVELVGPCSVERG